ncbi:MAG: class I SAM-dependent methyltransferase [Actinomycetota bacterium]
MEDRREWLLSLRRENERQENALQVDGDPYWSEIEPTHRSFVERFLSMTPPGSRILDAACGIGRYFPLVVESGRTVLGVDHTGSYIARARTAAPGVTVERHDLQDLAYVDAFDGVMCIDAMEFVPPEDWPVVLDRFRAALHLDGALYVTIELVSDERLRAANERARSAGHPVVDGEAISTEPEGYYHHYPSMDRVRSWIADAGFSVEDELEGPWHETYAYHHVLARLRGGRP